ncbi:MAG: hypothetical protein ACRDQZ_04110, partial [Mycobacteriales bacterium]
DTTPQDPTPERISDDDPAAGAPTDGNPVADSDPVADGDPVVNGAADGDAGPAADAPDDGGSGEQSAARERVGVELRVGLSTLLGHDRHPGEIPGWGPVTAETARTIVAAQRTGEWRYAITDPGGRLILAGITRCRPTISEGSQPGTGLPAAGPAASAISTNCALARLSNHCPTTSPGTDRQRPRSSGPTTAGTNQPSGTTLRPKPTPSRRQDPPPQLDSHDEPPPF